MLLFALTNVGQRYSDGSVDEKGTMFEFQGTWDVSSRANYHGTTPGLTHWLQTISSRPKELFSRIHAISNVSLRVHLANLNCVMSLSQL